MSMFNDICFGCGLFIEDLYYLMLANNCWHLSCLKCFDCGILLEQEKTCFTKNGRIFCRNDYFKNSSSICQYCYKLIRENDLIHRIEDNIYHYDCLTCSICQNHFQLGDEFGLKDNQIYCREHLSINTQIIHDDSGYNTSPNETRHSSFSPIYFLETDENQSIGCYHTKQKRLRTSFKLNQLRFLRSYFNLNHNPDAKELKNLSEKTSLSKRVLQVWFQNARAKYRRSNISSRDEKSTEDIKQIEISF